jgi:hypothetical protein
MSSRIVRGIIVMLSPQYTLIVGMLSSKKNSLWSSPTITTTSGLVSVKRRFTSSRPAWMLATLRSNSGILTWLAIAGSASARSSS